MEWAVFEVRRAGRKAGAVRPGLEEGWLTFQSATEKRRYGPLPADWETLSDDDLAHLCGDALPSKPMDELLDDIGQWKMQG